MVVWLTMGSRKTHHREREKSRRSEEEEGGNPRSPFSRRGKQQQQVPRRRERKIERGTDGRAVAVKEREVFSSAKGEEEEVLSLIRVGCRGQWPGTPPRCL